MTTTTRPAIVFYMTQDIGFFERLKLAWRVLIHPEIARKVEDTLKQDQARPGPAPAERVHASGLMLLGALQREGRIVDFLLQDVTAFADEDVGSAARVVHAGCSRVLRQFFQIEPALAGSEGSAMLVPSGFDPQRIRLTGNVTGDPPFRGTLKHHGWFASEVRMPAISDGMDPRVIAPAEVELP